MGESGDVGWRGEKRLRDEGEREQGESRSTREGLASGEKEKNAERSFFALADHLFFLFRREFFLSSPVLLCSFLRDGRPSSGCVPPRGVQGGRRGAAALVFVAGIVGVVVVDGCHDRLSIFFAPQPPAPALSAAVKAELRRRCGL